MLRWAMPRVPPCARCSSQGSSPPKALREHLLCSNKSAGCSGERGPTLGSPARWELSASSRLRSVTHLLPGVSTRSPTRTAQGARAVLAALWAVPGSRCPSCSQPGRELRGAPPAVMHRVCVQLASSQHTGALGPWVGDQQQGSEAGLGEKRLLGEQGQSRGRPVSTSPPRSRPWGSAQHRMLCAGAGHTARL